MKYNRNSQYLHETQPNGVCSQWPIGRILPMRVELDASEPANQTRWSELRRPDPTANFGEFGRYGCSDASSIRSQASLDLSRFDDAPLIAFIGAKETDYALHGS